jgi:hypothetical protein
MRTAVVMLLILGLSGCSSKAVDRVKKINQMRQIGLAYREFCDNHPNQAPMKPDDLKPYLDNPEADSLLRSGEVVFVWGVSALDLSKMQGRAREAILAYDKDVPSKGGVVVFANGEAETITQKQWLQAEVLGGKK